MLSCEGLRRSNNRSASRYDQSTVDPVIGMTDAEHIELLRDALDHIARVAQQTLRPTRRLDWITHRAKVALDGRRWTRDLRDTPKNRVAEAARRQQREFENLAPTSVDYDNDCAPD